ncbi:MAG: nucleotidyltransferase domain-containing protein [Planctomycetes bacterium]|nr:nucleotidyltransferase domain-containing protein [Planctomycetota bacterium]
MSTPDTHLDPAGLDRELAATFSPLPGIAAVYVFGSVARGNPHRDSDLDLGIVLVRRGEPTHEEYMGLLEAIGRVEHLAPGGRVDLVFLESAGPLFAHRVLSEGRRIYEGDRKRRIHFEASTYSRAMDFRPTYEIATRGRLTALRKRLRDL